jgi:hypothetical protein
MVTETSAAHLVAGNVQRNRTALLLGSIVLRHQITIL